MDAQLDARRLRTVLQGAVEKLPELERTIVLLVEFPDQDAAVEAVRRGAVDASASTAIGNRALVERANDSTLAAVATTSRSVRAPVGAFAVGKHLADLTSALDDVIGRYLGTSDHLALMRRYGFSDDELAPVLPGRSSAHWVRGPSGALSRTPPSARNPGRLAAAR